MKQKKSQLTDLASPKDETTDCKSIYHSRFSKKRKAGALSGKITIEPDFDELPADFLEYFI